MTHVQNRDALRGRHSSDPEFFSLYVAVLKVVLAAVVGSCIIAGIVRAIQPGGGAVDGLIGAIAMTWNGAFVALGAVTLGFILLRRNAVARSKVQTAWEPLLRRRSISLRRASRFENAIAVVAHAVFLMWWTGAVQLEQSIPLSAVQSLRIDFEQVREGFFWPVIGLSVAAIALNSFRLIWPPSRRLDHGLDLIMQLALLAVAAAALRAGAWIGVTGYGLAVSAVSRVDHGVTMGTQAVLMIVICVATILAGVNAWALIRRGPAQDAA